MSRSPKAAPFSSTKTRQLSWHLARVTMRVSCATADVAPIEQILHYFLKTYSSRTLARYDFSFARVQVTNASRQPEHGWRIAAPTSAHQSDRALSLVTADQTGD